jgi:ribonuclease HII
MLLPYLDNTKIEAGTDEAGRGCLAGPVVAAAVILPKDFSFALLNDSKKLNESQRLLCRDYIVENALAFSIQFVSAAEIDDINILQASFLAMHKSLQKIKHPFDHILVDGNRFKPFKKTPHTCVIKGDGKYASIAAASILAKTARDEYMLLQHKKYPAYNWASNKGYPTLAHRKTILEIGASPMHRKSFSVKVETQGKLW